MIEYPRLLFLLFVLLPLSWMAWRRYRRGKRDVLSIVSGTGKRDVANTYVVRWFFSTASIFLSIALGITALAGVRWGSYVLRDRPARADTLFVFDVSRSMLAQDVRPSRLARSIAVARTIADRRRGDSFGIVVFKGDGMVFLPITDDVVSIATYLDTVSPDLLSAPGTNIEEGLRTAVGAFPKGRDARRVMIVFTDGGFLDGSPKAGARFVAESDIELHLIAAGDEEPVKIPLGEGFLTDVRGEFVETGLRLDVVEAMAETAIVEYLRLGDPTIVDSIVGNETRRTTRAVAVGLPDRYRIPLGAGIIFLFLFVILRTVRWRGLL